MRRLFNHSLARVVVVGVFACSFGIPNAAAQVIHQGTADRVVARVGGGSITEDELLAYWQEHEPASFFKVAQERYEAEKRVINGIVEDRLLENEAKRRGETVDALLAEELPKHTKPISDSEIQIFYEQLRSGSGQQRPLEELRPMIVNYLSQRRPGEARQQYVEELKSATATSTQILLKAPRQRVLVGPNDAVIGPASAPVQIVEFADFQCSYCRQLEPILKQMLSKYRDSVQLVWKDYPLRIHPMAAAAAEAGRCAFAQGKFWEYHDNLFAHQQTLSPEDLKKLAADTGLDAVAFEKCLSSGQTRSEIAGDLGQGNQLGVGGTPMTFINGRGISGAASLETYEKLVTEELRANKTAKQP